MAGMCLALLCAGQSPRDGARVPLPGRFDQLVLAMLWAPEFCATPAAVDNPLICGPGQAWSFIAGGLWQVRDRSIPRCAPAGPGPDRELIAQTAAVMPSYRMIREEWLAHGACAGVAAPVYFGFLRSSFRDLTIPEELRKPRYPITTSVEELKRRFIGANPALAAGSVGVRCDGVNFTGLRICLDRGGRPVPCALAPDNCGERVRVRPVR